MYANQQCSRILRAFCKCACLNPRENHFNGAWGALDGIRDYCGHRSCANAKDRFFSLDAAPGFPDSDCSSSPAERRIRRT